jgi:hypothetical protein
MSHALPVAGLIRIMLLGKDDRLVCFRRDARQNLEIDIRASSFATVPGC